MKQMKKDSLNFLYLLLGIFLLSYEQNINNPLSIVQMLIGAVVIGYGFLEITGISLKQLRMLFNISTQRYNFDTQLDDAVTFYYSAGFLKKYKGTAQLKKICLKKLDEYYGKNLPKNKRALDFLMMELDPERFWLSDTELDVDDSNQVYKKVLQEWQKISQGYFTPKNLKEVWQSQTKPSVTFSLSNTPITLKPKYLNDYLDLSVLKEINRHLNSHKFYIADTGGQDVILACLSEKEKDAIAAKRGITFTSDFD